ncbi:MAG: aquaporin family protein [Acidobacteria bacterium]|nr:aquaporin family protein [Acidobacteriota bacterium]
MQKTGLFGELSAEFLGTFVLLAFGCGVNVMVSVMGHGGWPNINLGWGLGVVFGILVAGSISGAHLNPAVTLTMAVFRGLPWSKVLPYSAAQMLGAFAGAAVVFQNYRPAILKSDPGLEGTAGVFTTFPAFPEVWTAGMFDQVLGTALLLLLVLAITDERNQPSGILTPLLIGAVVVGIGACFGGMHGYAINPARDLGPRLMAAAAGYRNNGLTDGSGVWIVPVVGPLIGGLLGAAAYDFLIRRHLPRR